MNLKNKLILEEYRKEKASYEALGEIVSGKIKKEIKSSGIMVLTVEHRVKTEASLAGKLELKDEKYHFLSDITDILGARVICYFSDDVDKVTAFIQELFEVDWENSVDKRAQLNANAFGYLSVHFVCSLRPEEGVPPELTEKKFEIQIRSTLQHIWAEIEHDLGYKSEFGVPRTIRREFSRVAGLLEIADEQFIGIRDGLHGYGADIRRKIAENCADDVPLDLVSLQEYMAHNRPMRAFLDELSAICGAEISDISPENYLHQLSWMGLNTLGDLSWLLEQNRELALKLAKKALSHAELDILSSNVGLRYLCRADLLRQAGGEEKIRDFLALTLPDERRCRQQAADLLRTYAELCTEKKAEE